VAISTKKTIALVGDFREGGSPVHKHILGAATKAMKDWKVHTFDYRESVSATSAGNMNRVLPWALNQIDLDWVLILDGELIRPETLAAIKAPKAIWFTGYPQGGLIWRRERQEGKWGPEPWMIGLRNQCRGRFHVAAAGWPADYGYDFLPLACSPPEHVHEMPKNQERDLATVCLSYVPRDDRWISRQILDGLDLEVQGTGDPREWAPIISRTQISVVLPSNADHPFWFPPEFWASLASGALTLCRKSRTWEAAEGWNDKLEWFETADEARELIDKYLANPEDRKAMAARARQWVLKKHTYKARLESIQAKMDEIEVESERINHSKEPNVCLTGPDTHRADLVRAFHGFMGGIGIETCWDIPTPNSKAIIVYDHEVPMLAPAYKSLYPEIPLIVLARDFKERRQRDASQEVPLKMLEMTLAAADRIYVPSKQVKKKLMGLYDGLKGKIETMPFPIGEGPRLELTDNGRETTKLPEGVDNLGDGSLVSIGSFMPWRRHDLVLRAVAATNGSWPKVKIIGWDGPTRPWLQDLAKHLGVNVEFMVNATDGEKWANILRARLVVSPDELDGDGRAIIEAGGGIMQKPVLAIETPGLKSLLGDYPFFVPASVAAMTMWLEDFAAEKVTVKAESVGSVENRPENVARHIMENLL
jgi:glycosyltransferase involved in cell wall biosynthesis